MAHHGGHHDKKEKIMSTTGSWYKVDNHNRHLLGKCMFIMTSHIVSIGKIRAVFCSKWDGEVHDQPKVHYSSYLQVVGA